MTNNQQTLLETLGNQLLGVEEELEKLENQAQDAVTETIDLDQLSEEVKSLRSSYDKLQHELEEIGNQGTLENLKQTFEDNMNKLKTAIQNTTENLGPSSK